MYELARQHFTERELIDLTLAIVAINAWNRLAIAFSAVPGTFQVATPPSGGGTKVVVRLPMGVT